MILHLLLQIGDTRYALDARQVIEVWPLVRMREALGTPSSIAGLVNYRGQPVPVIDLSQLCCGRPARRLLSTRVLLVRPPVPGNEPPGQSLRWLCLVAERATEMRRFSADAFVPSAASPGFCCGLEATSDANELILKLDLLQLLRRFECAPVASRETQAIAWTSTPSPSF